MRIGRITSILFLSVWFNQMAWGQDDNRIAHGKRVFERYCTLCHGEGLGADGAPMLPGTHAIYIKYRGEVPPLLQHRSDVNIELVKTVVRNGLASMPPFRQTEVTDSDLEAIVAWFDSVADE
ncbi:MAG: cytochrome c [Gammaproteobacteria bacterium]|jgi:mono/diheme cytochrome c family protein|nr:cytochrome c [Gammaproteobacteria bacterium]MBT6043919.1 cytochrome c [Gammaproteobacteria bacterium]